MKLKIFSVYDSKAEAYLPPFFVGSTGLAVRMFSQAAQDSSHQFCKHASDFTLFELGVWDDEHSAFVIASAPRPLGTALDFGKVDPVGHIVA